MLFIFLSDNLRTLRTFANRTSERNVLQRGYESPHYFQLQIRRAEANPRTLIRFFQKGDRLCLRDTLKDTRLADPPIY